MTRSHDELVRRAEQRVGSVVSGKWTVDRLIGVGGMAAVYAATHRNRKKAALKVLHPEFSLDPAMKERFLREGYLANSVSHRGSVKVDDDGVTEDGSVYLVMELLEGDTVDKVWELNGGTLPVVEVLRIGNQLLDVLVAAHAAGVVHRDLKPENLFLTDDGYLKVLDFGIARLRETGDTATATRTGATMGTPAFMAPEQARGRWETVDGRTDLWAVGACMYTLITGRYVHGGGTPNEVLAQAIVQHADPIAKIMPDLPARVAELIDKALAYDMDARFQTAASMQQAVCLALRDCGDHKGDGARDRSGTQATLPGLSPAEPKQVSGPRVTAVGVSRTFSDSAPAGVRKPPYFAIAAATLGVLLTLGIIAFFGGGREVSAPNPRPASSAPSKPMDPPVGSAVIRVPDVTPSGEHDAPSPPEPSFAADEKQPVAPAANAAPAVRRKPKSSAKAVAKPAPKLAPLPNPRPVADPFASRR